MNPRLNDGGLSLSLRTDLRASRSTTGRDNRHHDRCPGDVYRGIAISVISIATLLADKASLGLSVLLCAVTAHMARSRRVAWIYQVQRHPSKSRLIGKK